MFKYFFKLKKTSLFRSTRSTRTVDNDLLGVELEAFVTGMFEEQRTWRESVTVNLLKLFHLRDEPVGAVDIDKTERT